MTNRSVPMRKSVSHPAAREIMDKGSGIGATARGPRAVSRRGSFGSVKELIAAVGTFIDGWNERCHPFVWTKPAEELLDHCRPGQRTSFPRH